MLRRSGLLLAAAVALGVYADRGQLAPGPAGLAPSLALPWLALAFAAGRIAAQRTILGAFAGVAAIFAGLATYYAFKAAYYGLYSIGDLRYTGHRWLTLAVLVGSTVGVTGAFSDRRGTWPGAVGWGALSGAAFAEAVVLRSVEGSRVTALTAVEIVVGALLLRHAARLGQPLVATTAAAAVTLLGIAAGWLLFVVL